MLMICLQQQPKSKQITYSTANVHRGISISFLPGKIVHTVCAELYLTLKDLEVEVGLK